MSACHRKESTGFDAAADYSVYWRGARSRSRSTYDGDVDPRHSPNRNVEPMDLDLSPNSQYPSSAALTRESQPSELDTESHLIHRLSSLSPISWKAASQAIGSVISLKNRVATTSSSKSYKDSQEDVFVGRPYSAPSFSTLDVIRPLTPEKMPVPSTFNRKSATSLSSPLRNVNKDSPFLKRKRGYGIPEKETDFCHYPKSTHKFDKQSLNGLNSASGISAINQDSGMKKLKTYPEDPVKGRNINTCVLFLVILFIIIIVVSLLPAFIVNRCKSSIRFHRETLENDFKTELFGQHIAASIVLDKLQLYYTVFKSAHYSNSAPFAHTYGCKPLVLSFHGSTGVGKTFVSRLISHSFTNELLNPLIIPLIFTHASEPAEAAELMFKRIKENLSLCRVNVLILDEMDKAPKGTIKGLSDAIQHLSSECHAKYPTVFLLLSNTHATKINLTYRELLTTSQVTVREDVSPNHFQEIFSKRNQWYDKLVDTNQVDAFLPFLPLEKNQVVQCIERESRVKGIPVTEEFIAAVLKELHLSQHGNLFFSATGCKRVSDKVDFIHSGGVKDYKMEEL